MTEATGAEVPEKIVDPPADVADAVAEVAKDAKPEAAKDQPVIDDGDKTVDATGDAGKTDDGKAEDKPEAKSAWGDDWREQMAGGDEAFLRILKRYSSPVTFAKSWQEREAIIRSGSLKKPMPDPKDEKAMAEWRKDQGIPEDPTGYKLPDTVQKAMTDADKPVLASFTEFAHAKGAPQNVVEIAAEWYVSMQDQMAEQQVAADTAAAEAAEEALRKDWAHGEYKANLTLGRRFMESIPGLGADFAEARLPSGRRLGDTPEFVAWAADMARQTFGDPVFPNSDAERRHADRKEEIDKIRQTDFDRYEREGLDKEYLQIIEKELASKKR